MLTVALQNACLGGHERRPQLLARLRPVSPDILLLCEAPSTDALLEELAGQLAMTALPLPPSQSGIPVAILHRPDLIPVDYCTDFSDQVTHGVAVAAWDVGLRFRWAVAVGHNSPFSRVNALRDTELAGWTAQRYGPYFTLGLDANQQPRGENPELNRMTRIDIARRFTDPLADPPSIPRTDVADSLAADGFHDCSVRLHEITGDPTWLDRTGASGRIDWIMASDPVVKAVTRGCRLTDPPDASNHVGLAFTFDTDQVQEPKLI
jgi:hypothetical protein